MTVDQDRNKFCRNEYNLTGLCNRHACPLANSSYATVKEEEGKCFLYIKTIERAHTPKDLWEKIELSPRYTKALEEISKHLKFWPRNHVLKVKHRLTRLHQYMIRIRQLAHKIEPKLAPIRLKHERREKAKEYKALVAARLDFAIKKELLDRLKKGTYGEMYNLNYRAFKQAIEEVGKEDVQFVEYEAAEGENSDIEDELKDEMEAEMEENGVEDLEDLDEKTNGGSFKKRRQIESPPDDASIQKSQSKKRKEGPRVEIEYEEEPTTTLSTVSSSNSW